MLNDLLLRGAERNHKRKRKKGTKERKRQKTGGSTRERRDNEGREKDTANSIELLLNFTSTLLLPV